MKYELTQLALESPLLITLPFYPHENVGVGGPYVVNTAARCGSCSAEEQRVFEAEQSAKPKRSFREAMPHEYLAIAEAYKATGGIPGYLIVIPDEFAPKQVKAEPEKK